MRAESASRCGFTEQTFQLTIKEMIMAITPNKDQVKGEMKDLGGKIQEEAGKLVGSKEQQTKGLQKQAEGAAEGRWQSEGSRHRRHHESIGASTARTGSPLRSGRRTGLMPKKTRWRAPFHDSLRS